MMKLLPCDFTIEYTHLGFASAKAFWLGIWNSDRVGLKSSIRTSALPRQQKSYWGLRVTQDAYFSLLTHTKQLLLVTLCDTTAGIQKSKVGRWHRHRRTVIDLASKTLIIQGPCQLRSILVKIIFFKILQLCGIKQRYFCYQSYF